MRIIIQEPPEKITLDFKSSFAPCKDCRYYQRPVHGDEVSKCNHEDRPFSAALVERCLTAGWKKGMT